MKNGTSLTFSWDEINCGSRGGDIITYNYQLKFENGTTVEDSKTDNLHVTLIALDACTQYDFNVAGVNNAGTGLRSDNVSSSTDAARK